MNSDKICDQIIEYSFYALFFLVPLVMTPWNFELFEYNKMMLVYVLTIVITVSWLIKMILAKRVLFKHTFLDIPLIIYLSSQLLSTVFSIDRHTSLFGYYSRFHGGLLSTISYLFLYWAFVSNIEIRKTQNAIRSLLVSAVLVTLYGMAEHFGIDAKYWVQDVQNRVFSTLGQPNWLAAWLVGLIPIPMAMVLSETQNVKRKTKENVSRITYLVLLAIFYLCLLYTKSRSALLALAPTYLIFWGLIFWVSRKEVKATLKQFLLLSSLFALFTFIAGSWLWQPYLRPVIDKIFKPAPAYAESPTLQNYGDGAASAGRQAAEVTAPTPTPIIPEVVQGGTESQTIRNIVWKGAIDIWKHYPLFGSGVETFAYSYYNFRPVEHNLVSEWDFLYNKAHNEYLNFLATTGAVGLGSYLLLIGAFTWWFIRIFPNNIRINPNSRLFGLIRSKIRDDSDTKVSLKNQNNGIILIGLFAGWISILITNFFGFSVVPVALQFFLYPGFAVALMRTEQTTHDKQHRKKPPELDWWQYGLIVIFVLCSMFFVLRLAQFWYADVLYAKGIKLRKQGNTQQAFETLKKATSLNPNEPVIRTEYGYSAALVAMAAHQEKQNKTSEQMIELALAQSGQALAISPRNVNLWKDKVKIHYLFSEVYPEHLEQAYQALLQAIELAPTDAKLWYNLGVLYTKLDQENKAIETLEKTVEIKENYQAARFALALLYNQAGQNKEAIEQTEYILTYINSSVPEVRELYKNLTGKEFGTK